MLHRSNTGGTDVHTSWALGKSPYQSRVGCGQQDTWGPVDRTAPHVAITNQPLRCKG